MRSFDPDAEVPEPLSAVQLDAYDHWVVEAMASAGIQPALIYAYQKTGLMVTKQNEHLLSKKDRREWKQALDEYERLSNRQRV